MNTERIFNSSALEFDSLALEIFAFQYQNNKTYQEFCNHLGVTVDKVKKIDQIPFLPIEFFKTRKVVASQEKEVIIFTSSGTTQNKTSKHFVTDLSLYEASYLTAFEHFYGSIQDYCVLALLPSYLERKGSSLIYMANDFIKKSNHLESGFYLNNLNELAKTLLKLSEQGTKTLLIGVSFALIDLAEQYPMQLHQTIIMETGGMKGRRKEMVREELHSILKKGLGVQHIHSEYGMTELLSQAYSKGNGIFNTPPWMKVLIRDTEDPLSYQQIGKSGGINVIDLVNINSCSFIATQDLGKMHHDNSFEILGRFDNSDVRGCNLMVL